MNRLWVAPDPARVLRAGLTLALDAEQSHYLCRVLRARPGSTIACFDGSGVEFSAEVTSADPRASTIELHAERRRQAPSTRALHVAIALTKADQDMVVQKVTELGVTDIWFLQTERTVARNDRLVRKRKVVASAAEQSGRLTLPRLHAQLQLETFLDNPPAPGIIFVPGADALATIDAHDSATLLVGPEGGWSDREVQLAEERGFRPAGLGALTLRATTAAIAAVVAFRQATNWQEWL